MVHAKLASNSNVILWGTDEVLAGNPSKHNKTVAQRSLALAGCRLM